MIARISFQHGALQVVAELQDDGSWICSDPAITPILNADYAVRDYSPADGQFGYEQVHEAALRFNGEIVYLKRYKRMPPGTIF
ncbi:MAG: hypothetical protein L0215_11890 [Gemmataceae bacterium]|nr:hypothetical protein [Gemmataceae bacterium]